MAGINLMNKVAVELENGEIKLFDSKQEAIDFLRRPAQTKALSAFIADNAELVDWIIEVQDQLTEAFESTKVRRVTKSEKASLEKALEAVAKEDNKAFKFLVENAKDIVASFKWPKVARGTEEEQAAALLKSVSEVTQGDSELAEWLIQGREQILEALEAGKVKREVNPAAAEGLARWRAEQAAKKAAEAAAAESK